MCWTAAAVIMMGISTAAGLYQSHKARSEPPPKMPEFAELMPPPPAPPKDAPKAPELNADIKKKAGDIAGMEKMKMGRKSTILTGLLAEDEKPDIKKGGIIEYTTKLGG